MIVKINGENRDVDVVDTLLSIVEKEGLSLEKIVVEYNKEIIPTTSLGNILVKENDLIEILSFVGGG